jgi:hypothetical protein
MLNHSYDRMNNFEHVPMKVGTFLLPLPPTARWSPFRSGDVLLFHSLTVHRGRHNRSGGRIRLAMSARYQGRSEPVDAGALRPHMGWTGWDDIYRTWPAADPLRYYWRAQDEDAGGSAARSWGRAEAWSEWDWRGTPAVIGRGEALGHVLGAKVKITGLRQN